MLPLRSLQDEQSQTFDSFKSRLSMLECPTGTYETDRLKAWGLSVKYVLEQLLEKGNNTSHPQPPKKKRPSAKSKKSGGPGPQDKQDVRIVLLSYRKELIVPFRICLSDRSFDCREMFALALKDLGGPRQLRPLRLIQATLLAEAAEGRTPDVPPNVPPSRYSDVLTAASYYLSLEANKGPAVERLLTVTNHPTLVSFVLENIPLTESQGETSASCMGLVVNASGDLPFEPGLMGRTPDLLQLAFVGLVENGRLKSRSTTIPCFACVFLLPCRRLLLPCRGGLQDARVLFSI